MKERPQVLAALDATGGVAGLPGLEARVKRRLAITHAVGLTVLNSRCVVVQHRVAPWCKQEYVAAGEPMSLRRTLKKFALVRC
jgi:hypothetical protein